MHDLDERVFVAGHRGMVGSAIVRHLEKLGCTNIVVRSRDELDLCNQAQVNDFFRQEKIDAVYLAAATVGGIHANDTYPADFIYDNLVIESNVIHAAHRAGVQKLLFLGSSCIYPRLAPQPIPEDALLQGSLELTNEPYAIAKIAGIKLCESYARQFGRDYRSVMPTNLYGPNDNFHPENSHVIPGLVQRFDQAKRLNEAKVWVWGSGKPLREFMHVDDMASACAHVMNLSRAVYDTHTSARLSHVNIGTGYECSIAELANLVAEAADYRGEIHFDTSKPDGSPRKLLDVGRLNRMGWKASITLERGISDTCKWFAEHFSDLRK